MSSQWEPLNNDQDYNDYNHHYGEIDQDLEHYNNPARFDFYDDDYTTNNNDNNDDMNIFAYTYSDYERDSDSSSSDSGDDGDDTVSRGQVKGDGKNSDENNSKNNKNNKNDKNDKNNKSDKKTKKNTLNTNNNSPHRNQTDGGQPKSRRRSPLSMHLGGKQQNGMKKYKDSDGFNSFNNFNNDNNDNNENDDNDDASTTPPIFTLEKLQDMLSDLIHMHVMAQEDPSFEKEYKECLNELEQKNPQLLKIYSNYLEFREDYRHYKTKEMHHEALRDPRVLQILHQKQLDTLRYNLNARRHNLYLLAKRMITPQDSLRRELFERDKREVRARLDKPLPITRIEYKGLVWDDETRRRLQAERTARKTERRILRAFTKDKRIDEYYPHIDWSKFQDLDEKHALNIAHAAFTPAKDPLGHLPRIHPFQSNPENTPPPQRTIEEFEDIPKPNSILDEEERDALLWGAGVMSAYRTQLDFARHQAIVGVPKPMIDAEVLESEQMSFLQDKPRSIVYSMISLLRQNMALLKGQLDEPQARQYESMTPEERSEILQNYSNLRRTLERNVIPNVRSSDDDEDMNLHKATARLLDIAALQGYDWIRRALSTIIYSRVHDSDVKTVKRTMFGHVSWYMFNTQWFRFKFDLARFWHFGVKRIFPPIWEWLYPPKSDLPKPRRVPGKGFLWYFRLYVWKPLVRLSKGIFTRTIPVIRSFHIAARLGILKVTLSIVKFICNVSYYTCIHPIGQSVIVLYFLLTQYYQQDFAGLCSMLIDWWNKKKGSGGSSGGGVVDKNPNTSPHWSKYRPLHAHAGLETHRINNIINPYGPAPIPRFAHYYDAEKQSNNDENNNSNNNNSSNNNNNSSNNNNNNNNSSNNNSNNNSSNNNNNNDNNNNTIVNPMNQTHINTVVAPISSGDNNGQHAVSVP